MTAFLLNNPLDILNGRAKDLDSARYSYKLGDQGHFGLDVVFSTEAQVDEREMSFILPFADGNARDGVGDLLEVGGIDVTRHRKNPISLFDHGKQVVLPIGMTEHPETKEYTVVIDPIAKTAHCKVFVYQGNRGLDTQGFDTVQEKMAHDRTRMSDHALFCEQLFDLWAKGYVRAGSIGYQVVKALELRPDYDKGTPQGLHLLVVLMLEASAVVLPANGDTVAKVKSMPLICGKPPSPYLIKSLEPYCLCETKSVVGFSDVVGTKAVSGGEIGLWKFNKTTGYWKLERTCAPDTAQQWLDRFQKDDPQEFFVLSRTKPSKDPRKKALPSDDISPEKAKEVLKDGTVHGHPLTEKQRAMFGAAASKDFTLRVGQQVKWNGKVGKVFHISKGGGTHPAGTIGVQFPMGAMWLDPQSVDPVGKDIKSIRMKYRVKSIDDDVLNFLRDNPGSKPIDIRKGLGHTRFNNQKPLDNPVHQALVRLRNSGKIEVRGGDWGEPSFYAKSLPNNADKCDSGMKALRLKYRAKGLPVGTRVECMSGPHRGKRGVITEVDRTESPPYVDLVTVKLDSGGTYSTNDASVIPEATVDRLRSARMNQKPKHLTKANTTEAYKRGYGDGRKQHYSLPDDWLNQEDLKHSYDFGYQDGKEGKQPLLKALPNEDDKAEADPSRMRDFRAGESVLARKIIARRNPKTGNTETFARTGDRLTVVEPRQAGYGALVRNSDGWEAELSQVEIRKTKGWSKGAPQPGEKVRWKGQEWVVDEYIDEDESIICSPADEPDSPIKAKIYLAPDSRVYPSAMGRVGSNVKSRDDKPTESLLVRTKGLKSVRMKYRTAKGVKRTLRKSRPGSALVRVDSKDLDGARELAEAKGLKFARVGTDSEGLEKVKLMGQDDAIDEVAKAFGRV